MEIITDPAALQQQALARRARGERIGFVPTMGYLHSGHTSLMDIARPRCDWLVASIYVNPLQFGPDEDFDSYPRDPEGDAARCAAAGVDALFMPENLYPPGHATRVLVSGITSGLCGDDRPGFFDGITTVVSRLFGIVQPTVAVFGEKDFQQLAVIRQMTRDLALPVEVLGGPLVRDDDGLAMSSRNRYLSDDERARALSISRTLRTLQAAVAATPGPVQTAPLLAAARGTLEMDTVTYLDIRDEQTLARLDVIDGPARAFVGGSVGRTRLIDNMKVR